MNIISIEMGFSPFYPMMPADPALAETYHNFRLKPMANPYQFIGLKPDAIDKYIFQFLSFSHSRNNT